MDVQFLEWDTHFFGFRTARILPQSLSAQQLAVFLDDQRAQGTRLVYWCAPAEAPFDTNPLGGLLVDRKTTFAMDLVLPKTNPLGLPAVAQEYQPGTADEILYDLALQSGAYSRFARDPRFPPEIFRALYREWMFKCLSGEMADAILVTGAQGHPHGMATVSGKKGWGEIGLIAVDSAARGKHLGEALVNAAGNWYRERGLKRARVVTQGDNLPACRLYSKCGYHVEKVEYFYHFWL